MLINKTPFTYRNIVFSVLLLVLTAACSQSGRDIDSEPGIEPGANVSTGQPTAPTLSPEPAPAPPDYIVQAEKNFQMGKELAEQGNRDGARYYFDQVKDILLNAGNHSRSIHHQRQLEHYLTRISEIELSSVKDSLTAGNEDQKAFLDEVNRTPLSKPSIYDILRMRDNVNTNKPLYSVPVTINSRVVSFIKAFCTVRQKNIQNALNRSVEYIDRFKRIFTSYGLPEDLAYLPIIESGFRVHALSRARALGVWQFMASPARGFGLRVDWVVDERRDPYKAAHAAAKYLKELYTQFNDWYLALACYNGGTKRITRAIRRLKTKDFFKIARSRYIRRETRNYVPAFLASLVIAKNPETYGFTFQPVEKQFKNTKSIRIPSPVNLKEVARLLKMPYRQFRKINPELIREFTPFNKKHYTIRVPETIEADTLAQLKRLPPSKRYFVGWYKVRRGDSLYSISRKFRTSVRKIKKANKLRSNLIRPGKRLLIPRG